MLVAAMRRLAGRRPEFAAPHSLPCCTGMGAYLAGINKRIEPSYSLLGQCASVSRRLGLVINLTANNNYAFKL